MKKDKNTELYFQIPRNVITRFEIFHGFGWKQLLFGALGFLLASGFWKLFSFLGIPLSVRLFICILLFGIPVFISIPNPALGNISLLDRLIKAYKFYTSQKMYRMRKVD